MGDKTVIKNVKEQVLMYINAIRNCMYHIWRVSVKKMLSSV